MALRVNPLGCPRNVRVKFAEELGTMSKNRLRWITLVRGPIWGIHSLTLMISWLKANSVLRANKANADQVIWQFKLTKFQPFYICSEQKGKQQEKQINSREKQSFSKMI